MMDGQAKRKLKIDMNELAIAFDNGSWEMSYFLNLETGDVQFITEDSTSDMQDFYAEVESAGDDERDAAFREALEQNDLPEWRRAMALEAYEIESDVDGSRYLEVPPQSSRDGYRDMEEFIETVQDEQLQDRLWRAIDGRGAFRVFKNELDYHDEERQRWFAYRDARLHERVLDWLAEEGIEPITE